MNKRIYVRKRDQFNVEDCNLLNDFQQNLNLSNLTKVSKYNIYDIFNITNEVYEEAKIRVFSEPVTDTVYEELNLDDTVYLAIESLPNQFDMRADSANECLKLISPNSNATCTSAELLVFEGITADEIPVIENYYVNKIENRVKDLSILEISEAKRDLSEITINGFITMDEQQLLATLSEYGFSFSLENFKYVQQYYQEKEQRDPMLGEIQIIDTYWSDHCRHLTFNTILDNIKIEDEAINETYNEYLKLKSEINDTKPVSLMNIGTIAGKHAVKTGKLTNLEQTTEDNAISVEVSEDEETYLLQFKNETHNHPTEIEPYGGASTCIGGAIRDPLSGRAYVYQGMRISGSADVKERIDQTLTGKLPQRVISKRAADGFSAYGNQIGLATTYVKELSHPGYKAKHLEAGAVVGSVNKKNVTRKDPELGDLVLLIGGRTGYDGIGGATGSSKSHNENSINEAAVEVQKGNAPVERKIQRLFNNPQAVKLIKKSNDFGAGGVSVAIGELSPSIEIYLDRIPLKTENLKASEIAISESQERMAVVLNPADVELFTKLAIAENLEITEVAKVTDTNRLVMKYYNDTIIDIDRDFLDSSGVEIHQDVEIPKQKQAKLKPYTSLEECFTNANIVDNKTMDTLFDSTVGATTVLMPYGGKYQLTKNQTGIQKLPQARELVSAIAYGFDPYLSSDNPYLGSMYAVIDSVTKLIASGMQLKDINLSFQEYFMRLNEDPKRYGVVLSSLLGALKAQMELGTPAIGGKDSMSGTYEDLDVPPTLISFAFAPGNIKQVVSSEAKASGDKIYILSTKVDEEFDFANLRNNFSQYEQLVKAGKVNSAVAVNEGGIAVQIAKMLMGNKLGCEISTDLDLFAHNYGTIIFTSSEDLDCDLLGKVTNDGIVKLNDEQFTIDEIINLNTNFFADVYPSLEMPRVDTKIEQAKVTRELKPKYKAVPNVFIPVFSGTNSEMEMERAFKDAGCQTNVWVFKNQDSDAINRSIEQMVEHILNADIIAISGGFSGGDEPDGSGKYIVNILANAQVKAAIENHLAQDKLILGICNGFQALIKSGLIGTGKVSFNEQAPTLFRNDCNYHISAITQTQVQTTNSPWLSNLDMNETYQQVISHGEGKLVASDEVLAELLANEQVAFTYANTNPNGSMMAIEGLVSPDGKVLGKMAHSERYIDGLYQNIPGEKHLNIFKNAVDYFKNGEK